MRVASNRWMMEPGIALSKSARLTFYGRLGTGEMRQPIGTP